MLLRDERTTKDLTQYDVILINTSAGKDSQAMMDYVVWMAENQGVKDSVVAVHADLGRVEWKGTKELAAEQCAFYGIPLHIVSRNKGDLLDQVEARGMWPDNGNRYCTSDQKRDQVAKLFTYLAGIQAETIQGRPIRILNCMGLRAQESPKRAKMVESEINKRASSGKRIVENWLPIHKWTTAQVWETIHASGVRYHYAYDLGMPRLSCCFCIFAPENALLLAGKHNRELLSEYVRVEKKIGHTFRNGFAIASIEERLERGEEPGEIQSWSM
jgi:3'-phosphoadenosine 5'-phosphosulfate sulfotransferase (PAPS reductase)/FAD synthetase